MAILSKLMRKLVYDPDYEVAPLAEGEQILREGCIVLVRGFGGSARLGKLVLTNRRVMWAETASPWPLARITGQIPLLDIVSVDRGSLLNSLAGTKCIRIHLKYGKVRQLFDADGKRDAWVATLNEAVELARAYPYA